MSHNVPCLVLGVALLSLTVPIACGSDGNANPPGGTSGSAGQDPGQSSGILGGGGDAGDPNADGGGTNPGNCNAPVDMYVMLDRSGSMVTQQNPDGNIGETGTKWERAITALSGYFNSESSKDQAAAFQFFPLDNQTDALCANGNGYEKPRSPTAEPFYTTLQSKSFDKILNDEKPSSGLGTPTEAAIRGMARFTAANRRPGRVTIGILITDGDPRNCDENLDHLATLLQTHYDATKVRTYVIGMEGATFSNLEKIAKGGGTPEHADTVGTLKQACGGVGAKCHFWNVGDGNPEGFIAALKAIQESADGCKPGGGVINPPK